MQGKKTAPFVSAVVVAAGSSTRMGGVSKQLLSLRGKTVIRRCLEALGRVPEIRQMIVVVKRGEETLVQKEIDAAKLRQPVRLALGGATRQQSVQNGVALVDGQADYVAVHDGARPLVEGEAVRRVIQDAAQYGASALAVPVKDTIKQADPQGMVLQTPDRRTLWAVQTPQVFRKSLYLQALEAAAQARADYTDDCQLFERAGFPVHLTAGDYRNIKITTLEDIKTAAALLPERDGDAQMRIGHGYDVHRLVEGRPLILGGVKIPHERGLLGHSDADVLAHAVSDALLGAAGLGDIGLHFPDTDNRYLNADSIALLRQVTGLLAQRGLRPVNIDATVIAQRPKLRPYIQTMQERLAEACGLAPGQVSVKATTEEGLGFSGKEEGIAAHAVCLVAPAD